MDGSSCKCSYIPKLLVLVLIVGEWVRIQGVVVLEMLALYNPAFMRLAIADDDSELAVIRLRLRPNSLSLVLGEFPRALGVLLVVDAV